MKKRFLCLLLSVVFCVMALPLSVSAFAHSDTTPLPEGVYKSWKQYDERWGSIVLGVDPWTDASGVYHENETMAHAGCLISSMAILARAYGLTLADGTSVDPGTLGEAMYDGGSCRYLNDRGAAKYSTAFDALIPGVTFYQFQQPADPADTISALLSNTEKEYIVIAGVNGGGHYVAVDYISDGEVYICDPGYAYTTLSSYSVYCLLVYEIGETYVDPGTVIPGKPVWEVVEPAGVRVRSGAGLSYERLTAYSCGTRFEVSETAEADGYLWGKTPDGWCALRMLDESEIYCICLSTDQYSVTYHMNGGTGGPEAQLKMAGQSLTLASEIPVKEGYRFLGWSEDPSAVSASYVAGGVYREDAALVLHAVWMAESDIFAYGIDASAYQGDVDWETVAASGIEFVILRAGTSNGKDTRFEENYLGAKAAGLHIGSYFFSYALTVEEALADAALFKEWLAGKEFDMPIFLDVETDEQSKLPIGELTALSLAFLSVLEETGYYCGVYSSATWFEDYLDGTQFGGREHLWVAKWTLSGTLSQNMSEQFAMYQYSETGTVPGIEGAVDLNVCYVDFPALIEEHGQGGVVEPPVIVDPPIPPAPVDPKPLPDSGLTVSDEFLFGGKANMTVSEWKALFDGAVVFADGNREALADDAVVYTGCVAVCGSTVYTVAVRGDVNGDGDVNARDYILMKRHVLGTYTLEGAPFLAGCLSGDEILARDYMMLKRHVLGTYNLYQ